jgi:DtxR family Mn-dependent transcriptional regulator
LFNTPKQEPFAVLTQLSPSLEDYLETIFHCVASSGIARPRDIARTMGVSGASVTGALRALTEKHLINYEPYELITLTPKGTQIASRVVKRHQVLASLLHTVFDIPPPEAEKAACKMEHGLSSSVLERMLCFQAFIEHHPHLSQPFLEAFAHYCAQTQRPGGEEGESVA